MLDLNLLYNAMDPEAPVAEAMFMGDIIEGVEEGHLYPWRFYRSGDPERKVSHKFFNALGQVLKKLNRTDDCYRRYLRNVEKEKVEEANKAVYLHRFAKMFEEIENEGKGAVNLGEGVGEGSRVPVDEGNVNLEEGVGEGLGQGSRDGVEVEIGEGSRVAVQLETGEGSKAAMEEDVDRRKYGGSDCYYGAAKLWPVFDDEGNPLVETDSEDERSIEERVQELRGRGVVLITISSDEEEMMEVERRDEEVERRDEEVARVVLPEGSAARVIDDFERENIRERKGKGVVVVEGSTEDTRRQREIGVEVGEDLVEIAPRSVKGKGKVPASHVQPIGEVSGHPLVEVDGHRRVVVCGLLFDPEACREKARSARKRDGKPPLPPMKRNLRPRRVVTYSPAKWLCF